MGQTRCCGIWAAALISLGLMLLGSTVYAQGFDSQTDTEISRLINQGKIAAAAAILESSNPSAVDRLFFNGRLFKAQGRLDEAIATFREVLRQDPGHLNAEFELALSLMDSQAYDAAEFHFERLVRIDRREDMRDSYYRILDVIDRNKPFGINGSFSLLPSTNVNRGSAKTVFDTRVGRFVIDPDSRRKSGVGVQAGIDGYLRKRLDPQNRLILDWSLIGAKYRDKSFDSVTLNLAPSYEHIIPQSRRRITPYMRYRWSGNDDDNIAIGLQLSMLYNFDNRNTLGMSAAQEYVIYSHLENLNGFNTRLRFSLQHQYDRDLSIWGGIGGDVARPRSGHNQYNGASIFIGAEKAWKGFWSGGLHTTLSPTIGKRRYEENFPLTDRPREDSYYRVAASLYHTRLNFFGITPKLSCFYTLNRSNISFYDYEVFECVTALTSKF